MKIATTPTFEPGDRVVLRHTVHVCGERFTGPGRVTETQPGSVQRVRVVLDDHDGRHLWVFATELRAEPSV